LAADYNTLKIINALIKFYKTNTEKGPLRPWFSQDLKKRAKKNDAENR